MLVLLLLLLVLVATSPHLVLDRKYSDWLDADPPLGKSVQYQSNATMTRESECQGERERAFVQRIECEKPPQNSVAIHTVSKSPYPKPPPISYPSKPIRRYR